LVKEPSETFDSPASDCLISNLSNDNEGVTPISKAQTAQLNSETKAIERSPTIPKQCPNCGKENTFVFDSGELVCTNCGYVLRESIEDTAPEWRTFPSDEGEDSRARVGSSTNIARHDMGLSTIIGSENKDASGKSLNSSMKSTLERLRTWDRRTQVHSSRDRDLIQAFNELNGISQKMNLSALIVEKAAYIYRKALEQDLIRGRTISGMIAAALYAAIRESDTPRTIKDIAESSGAKLSDIRRDYRIIVNELDLRMPVFDPRRLVSRITSRAGAKQTTETKAIDLVKRSEEIGITTGKDPTGVAAAAVYLASLLESDHKTEKEISEASGLTEITIRHRYLEMKDSLGIEIPR
jgi:transcription initiation factor TFIIB